MVPMLTLILISVHYYAVRKQEISPIHELFENKPPTRRKIPFLPDQVFFELAVIALMTFFMIVVNQYFWDAKLESHANPTQTPNHTKAPWYFLWLQGMLKFGNKLWFGLIWPPVIIGALLLLPYIDRNPSRRFKDRKIAIFGACIGLIGMGFLSYAGLPGYGIQQTAGSEITTEWVPIEGEGIVDETAWAALPDVRTVYEVTIRAGAPTTTRIYGMNGQSIDEATLTPETRAMYEEFRATIEKWNKKDARFIDPVAALTIEPWLYETDADGNIVQVDGKPATKLKKATVNLAWTATEVDPQTGAITPLLDKQGQVQLSKLQQSDFLDRDSHDDRIAPTTTGDTASK